MRLSAKFLPVASALLALTLAGCVNTGTAVTGSIRITLPPPPGDLQTCFNRLVPVPAGSTMSAQQVVRLITDLKQSEASKSACGRRLLAWYAKESAGLR